MDETAKRRIRRLVAGLVGTATIAGIGLALRAARSAARKRDGVERSISIGRETGELQARWFDMLPTVMEPFADVTPAGGGRLRWDVHGLGKTTFETAVFSDIPGDTLRWATDTGTFAGSARFRAAPDDRGTEVALRLQTRLPAAIVGPALLAALRRFKSLCETGELPSLECNSSGRR